MTYQKRNKNNQTILGNLLSLIFQALFALISLPFQKKKKGRAKIDLDKEAIREKWTNIEQMAKLGGESNMKAAILEADKLLDMSLKGLGVAGENLGERLKSAKEYFSYDGYEAAWQAHKVRNRLAHEFGYDLLRNQALEAMENFYKALNDLRVLK